MRSVPVHKSREDSWPDGTVLTVMAFAGALPSWRERIIRRDEIPGNNSRTHASAIEWR